MALTHVCVWDPVDGFRRVTVTEACQLYPYGASARSGHFVCELCAQNVLLTAPGVNVQHFRHDPNSPNKECDERQTSFDPTYGRRLHSLSSHTMPLRLLLTKSNYLLQMGFFLPPNQDARCDRIRIAGDSHQVFEYSFERIETDKTTYLDLGSIPSKVYGIDYVNATPELKKYWSNKVQGISHQGSFFDSRTGQILQLGGKAYSGNYYYLLQRWPLHSNARDIVKEEISRTQVTPNCSWYLYRIHARHFSEDAAKFFLQYSIFLTEKPTEFYPVWPAFIQTPYFIYHNSDRFFFYLCGDDAELKSFPPQRANPICTDDGKLYRISTQLREQLVSLGKSGALGFKYLIKQAFNKTAVLPSITIIDQQGTPLTEEIYKKIPKTKQIMIHCDFDGKAILYYNGKVKYIYRLSAGQNTVIDGLTFNTELQFYQGCDCVRSVRFIRENAQPNMATKDEELVRKLETCSGAIIPVTHSIGALAEKYASYPQTKRWLFTKIRQGKISLAALQLIRASIPDKRRDESI